MKALGCIGVSVVVLLSASCETRQAGSGGATAGSSGAAVDVAPASDGGTLSPDAAQTACTTGTLKPGNSTLMIPSGGATRTYIVPGGTHVWPSAMADFNRWGDLDQYTDAPVAMPMHPACQIRSKCAGGTETVLCSTNTPHNLYGPAMGQMVGVADVGSADGHARTGGPRHCEYLIT